METGVPVPVRIWNGSDWDPPKTYQSLEDLLRDAGASGAGYGKMGQAWELEGLLIGPPTYLYQKVLYAWVDDNHRLQITNSMQEATELMG